MQYVVNTVLRENYRAAERPEVTVHSPAAAPRAVGAPCGLGLLDGLRERIIQ